MVYRDERVRYILDSLPALVVVLDKEFHYRFANRQHAAWFGESPDTLVGLHIREVIGERAFEQLRPWYEQFRNNASTTYSGEVLFSRGGNRFIYATCMELAGEPGEDDGLLVMMNDVSELKNVERALDATTLRAHAILETAVDAVITIDASGTIQSCNGATRTLFGFDSGELVGRNVKMLMPTSYASQHDGYLERYLETGEKRIIGIGREVIAKRKDGTEFPAQLAVGEFTDRDRRYFTGFIRDVTAQKKAEQEARTHLDELAHLARLSSIESLASNIMHEINQPLTAIVSMSQALLRMQQSGGVQPAMVEEVLDRFVNQCVRVNGIVQQMRELARKTTPSDRATVTVDEIIGQVKQLIDHELVQHDINLTLQLDSREAPVTVNRIQIEQVLLNLLQNAIHAVVANLDERTLVVESRVVDSSPPMVAVSVKDNGHGLPESEQGDVFDPFFTTKEKGLGQGLAISRSIIEAHNGKITANNDPGGGAVFNFTLPALDAANE